MTNSKDKEREEKPEVWLSFRSRGTDTVHRMRLAGAVANRLAHKLTAFKPFVWAIADAPLRRVSMQSRVDFLEIEGIYEAKKSLKEAKIHLQVSQSRNWQARTLQDINQAHEAEVLAKRVRRSGRISTHRMSFHVGPLEQAVILFCPVTGIVGKLEMPYCPVALTYDHPLSRPSNALTLLKYHFSIQGQQDDVSYLKEHSALKLDRQTLAGCLLSLLKGKHLLAEEQEETASERNLVLQGAGFNVLSDLLKSIVIVWDNPQVWKKMPRLNLEWKAHSGTESSVSASLQHYTKLLQTILNPLQSLSNDEAAKIFAAQRSRSVIGRGIKIHSAVVVETRKIKETKTEAYKLLEVLRDGMNIVERTVVAKTIRDLLLLPESEKAKTATLLRNKFVGNPVLIVPAKALAVLIEKASTKKLMGDLGLMLDEVAPVPTRSIAQILESKKEKNLDKLMRDFEPKASEGEEDSNGKE